MVAVKRIQVPFSPPGPLSGSAKGAIGAGRGVRLAVRGCVERMGLMMRLMCWTRKRSSIV